MMARPREFDEEAVLDAAVQCFWSRGFEATSVRDLAGSMGITGASLYNAFGDKRSLYRKALDHYVENSITDRIRRCADKAPRAAIALSSSASKCSAAVGAATAPGCAANTVW